MRCRSGAAADASSQRRSAVTTVDPRTAPPPATPTRAAGVHRRPRRGFYGSPTGKKTVMAVTGLFLLFYVVIHLFGNLKLFFGEDDLNHYAEWLRSLGQPLFPGESFLWIFRAVLALAFGFHIHAAVSLTRNNRSARPQAYRTKREWAVASYASRTMLMSGIIVGLFVVFHILDLTVGMANPTFVGGEVHANVIASFERVPVAAFYILGNLALGLHLAHGIWSATQTLGVDSPGWERARQTVSVVVAGAIVVGNISMPVAVLAGWVS
jgi:succinate dehydrogenase / fumarate reductase, cytochrome b subunit